MGNGKWEMTEMGKSNGRCVTQSTQQHCNRARCDDEASCSLATFVALLRGESAVCDKNK